jgi:hypothetical protein
VFHTHWCTSAVSLSYENCSPSWCLIVCLKTWKVLGAELVLVMDRQDIPSETGPAVSLGYEMCEDRSLCPWANQIVSFSCYSVLQLLQCSAVAHESLFHLSPVTQTKSHVCLKMLSIVPSTVLEFLGALSPALNCGFVTSLHYRRQQAWNRSILCLLQKVCNTFQFAEKIIDGIQLYIGLNHPWVHGLWRMG